MHIISTEYYVRLIFLTLVLSYLHDLSKLRISSSLWSIAPIQIPLDFP